MMKVLIGIPAYSGAISVSTAHSLIHEMAIAPQLGIQLNVMFQPGMSLVHSVRNLIAHKFLTEYLDHERLAFIDSDVGWKAGSLVALLQHREHVVAGGCRRRKDPEDYAIQFLDEVEQDEKTKLIEIKSIGMAFTSISRHCLQEFRRKTPELAYGFEDKTMHGFFQCPIEGGRIVGEDTWFCEKWRSLGGKVFLDPRYWITHTDGNRIYGGCVGAWLNKGIAEAESKLQAAE